MWEPFCIDLLFLEHVNGYVYGFLLSAVAYSVHFSLLWFFCVNDVFLHSQTFALCIHNKHKRKHECVAFGSSLKIFRDEVRGN